MNRSGEIELSNKERDTLNYMILSGVFSTDSMKRARILLMLNENTMTVVMTAFRTSKCTIKRIIDGYRLRGIESIFKEMPRNKGVNTKINVEELVLDIIKNETPPSKSRWTYRDLSDYICTEKGITVSISKVYEIIKRNNISLKKM
jgi:transposase